MVDSHSKADGNMEAFSREVSRRRLIQTIGGAAAGSAFLAACGSSSKSKAAGTSSATAGLPGARGPATGSAYAVGMLGGFTGFIASTMTTFADGIEAYFATLNAAGGVNNHPIKVVKKDDQSSNTTSAIAAITDFATNIKPIAIAGGDSSAVTDAYLPRLKQSGIPLMAIAFTDLELASGSVFGIDLSFPQQVTMEVAFLKSLIKPGDTPKVALLYADSPAGLSLNQIGQQRIKSNGWDLVLSAPLGINPVPTDLSPLAAKIVNAKADYVLGGIFLELPILLMSALKTLGFSGKVINFESGGSIDVMSKVNNPDLYTIRPYGYYTDDTPGMKKMVAAVKAAGGDPSGGFTPQGWATAAIIAKALAACSTGSRTCSAADVRDGLANLGTIGDLDGISAGPLSLSSGNADAVSYGVAYHYVGGKMVAVSQPLHASAT